MREGEKGHLLSHAVEHGGRGLVLYLLGVICSLLGDRRAYLQKNSQIFLPTQLCLCSCFLSLFSVAYFSAASFAFTLIIQTPASVLFLQMR
jgi:hypothetical protein